MNIERWYAEQDIKKIKFISCYFICLCIIINDKTIDLLLTFTKPKEYNYLKTDQNYH